MFGVIFSVRRKSAGLLGVGVGFERVISGFLVFFWLYERRFSVYLEDGVLFWGYIFI